MVTETHNRGSTRNGGRGPEPPRTSSPRTASERARRRHRRLIVFYLFTFFMVILAAVALSLTVLFRIDTIEVSGNTRYSSEQVISASGIRSGENLFLADTKHAGAAIAKKLPYIGAAQVSRRLPAKIVIEVKETAASGAVAYNGGYVLIGDNGKALEQTAAVPNNCPVILGLELSSAQPGQQVTYKSDVTQRLFETLTQALQKNGMDKITKIDLRNTYSILVEYDGRITMNMGISSGFDYKIRFAKSVLDSGKLGTNAKGTLNLSVAEEEDKVYFDPSSSSSSSSAVSSAASKAPSGSKSSSSAGSASKAASSKAN